MVLCSASCKQGQGENQFLSSVISEWLKNTLFSSPCWTKKQTIKTPQTLNLAQIQCFVCPWAKHCLPLPKFPERIRLQRVRLLHNSWMRSFSFISQPGAWRAHPRDGPIHTSTFHTIWNPSWDALPQDPIKAAFTLGTREHSLGKRVNCRNALSPMAWARPWTSRWEVDITQPNP